MAIDYGVPVETYIDGLVAELAAITGKTEEDKTHKAAVEAELSVARNEPATPPPAPFSQF